MRVIFRTDASFEIGTGHVMRCLTLAEELQNKGAETHFICRDMPGNLSLMIKDKGHQIHILPGNEIKNNQEVNSSNLYESWLGASVRQDANETSEILEKLGSIDWLVVDHYAIEKQWESFQKKYVEKILVIDDLANREHMCDVLLDQNYYRDLEKRYTDLLSDSCQQLLGPNYSLLRSEFREVRKQMNREYNQIKRLFVFFGGVDATNMTGRVIESVVLSEFENIFIDVVIGSANPYKHEIEMICAKYVNIKLHVQVNDMAKMMASADLSVGSGGTVTWERCCLGLPTLAFSVAENQKKLLHDGAEAGLVYVPDIENPSAEDIACHLNALLGNRLLCEHISRSGLAVIDGMGAMRVANIMMTHDIELEKATMSDMQKIYDWRNDARVRKYSNDSSVIDFNQHKSWFEKVIEDSSRPILIGSLNNKDLGVVRFEISNNEAEISVYLSPYMHGKGYGVALISAGEKWLRMQHPQVEKIIAEVLSANKASVKLFEKCGYKSNTVSYQKSIA